MTDTTLDAAAATDVTVRLAADGDTAAFERLVARHHASMAGVAYAITGDVDAACHGRTTSAIAISRSTTSLRSRFRPTP